MNHRSTTPLWSALLATALAGGLGCASPGPYGYSRTYTPHDAESDALRTAAEFDPVMAERRHAIWAGKSVALFGIVEEVKAQPDGAWNLKLSMRRLEPRNLCASPSEDSCRVTVSDRQYSIVRAILRPHPEDVSGKHRLREGSLLRVIGILHEELAPKDQLAIIRTTYYRHWPIQHYVTSSERRHMLR
jgi:hypothetical protein